MWQTWILGAWVSVIQVLFMYEWVAVDRLFSDGVLARVEKAVLLRVWPWVVFTRFSF